VGHPREDADAIGQPERATQNRVIALFRDELGCRYLGDWTDRGGNSNLKEDLLPAWLTQQGSTIPKNTLNDGACPICRAAIPGVWH